LLVVDNQRVTVIANLTGFLPILLVRVGKIAFGLLTILTGETLNDAISGPSKSKLGFALRPLAWIDQQLKYRVLHPQAVV
jgi:hypothetical protein